MEITAKICCLLNILSVWPLLCEILKNSLPYEHYFSCLRTTEAAFWCMILKAPKSRQTTFKAIGSCNCRRKFASLFLLVTSSVCAAVDYSSFSFLVKTKDHFSVCEFYCWMPTSRIAFRIEANTDFNFLGHILCVCADISYKLCMALFE